MTEQIWTEETIRDFWRQNTSEFAGDKKAKVVLRLTKKYIRGRKLDVGAGSGALIGQLSNAVGVDIVAKPPFIWEGSVDALPCEDSAFDTVFCTDVLEHLTSETLRKGLQEIHRVMKADANLIIVAPYREDMKKHEVYCPNCKSVFHRWGHIQRFDGTILRRLLSSADLDVVHWEVMPLPLMSQRWWLWRHWKFLASFRIFKPDEVLADLDILVIARKM